MGNRRARIAFSAAVIIAVSGSCMSPDKELPRTYVVMLGSGTPNPEPDRSGPSIAIVVEQSVYIIDAGPGLVRRAEAARQLGAEALAMPNLKRIFITHLHSDHTVGLPDLIFTPWVLDREEPLLALGPPGLSTMVDHISAAWEEDIAIRTGDLQPHTADGYKVIVAESSGGEIYRDSLVVVTAIAVDHGAWPIALAYMFETPDGVIVISGDATYTPAIEAAATGADILIHEVISTAGLSGRPADWQRYHTAYHTTTEQLSGLASRAQPKLLVLYHQLLSGVTEEELLQEIRSGYDGEVRSAHDLDIYTLGGD